MVSTGCPADYLLRVCLGALAVLSFGCEAPWQDQPERMDSPSLVLVDSIQFEQTDEAFLVQPKQVVPAGDDYLVSDAGQARIFLYDQQGRLIKSFGQEGEGPGEFHNVAGILPMDEEILVVSWEPRAAQLFDRSTGSLLRRYELVGSIESVQMSDGQLLIGGSQYSTGSGVRRVSLSTGDVTPLAPLPDEFSEGGPLGGIFPGVSFAGWADTLVVGYEPLNFILVTVRRQAVDTVQVPNRLRRGVPEDPEGAIIDALNAGPYSRVFGVLSTLRGIHRRSDGSFILVHFDHRPEGPPVTSKAFVTVLSADRRRACVDAVVPLGPAAQPAVGFDGDKLLVLEQIISGGEAVPVLRSFQVDTEGCRWITLDGEA